jgi:hypothetical protein
MPPYSQFKKQVKELMKEGCSLETAIDQIKMSEEYTEAKSEYEALANQADKLLEIKQQIEWEIETDE